MPTLPRRNVFGTCLALALMPSLAWPATRKTASKKKGKASNYTSDSGESAADRRQRMQRECRGLPNAGACQGYGYGS